MQPPAKTRRTVRYGVVDGGAWGERGRRMVGVAWQVTPVAGRSIVNKSQRQITYQQQFPTPRPVCYYSYRWSSPAATAATWPTCLVKVLAYQMQPWRGTPSPEIEGDHVQSGTSLIAIIYIAGLSHLLTWHLATVIQCTVLQDATQLGGWELSQHQQPVVHCKGRSRGPWVRGAAVGSCRE